MVPMTTANGLQPALPGDESPAGMPACVVGLQHAEYASTSPASCAQNRAHLPTGLCRDFQGEMFNPWLD